MADHAHAHPRALPGLALAALAAAFATASSPACKSAPPPAPPPPAAKTATVAAPAPPPVAPDPIAEADRARIDELSFMAAAAVDAYANAGAEVTPDGAKVVFRSNRDGFPQLYVAEIAKPDAPATRLVTTTERTIGQSITPDGKGVVFRSDRGADELFSLFRVDADGSNLVELTPGESLQRDVPFLPESLPGTMIFSARSFKETKTRIYSGETAATGSVPKMILEIPGPGGLADVSRDGRSGLFIALTSPSESSLMVVDLEGAKSSPLYPAKGKAERVSDADFSRDGASVFVATDGGGEQGLLLLLDVTNGKERARYVETKPPTASIEEIEVSPAGDRVAVQINAGDHTEVRILDATTLKAVAQVALPLGSGGINRFTPDGKKLIVTWSTPDTPPDLMLADVKTGKVTPLRKEPRPTLASLPPLSTSIARVPSFDKTEVPVNVYLPKVSAKAGKGKKEPPPAPMPVIVSVHGGPAASSAVGWNPFVRFVSGLGYAVVEPNVRGSTGFGRAYEMADNKDKRLDAVNDLEAVGRWVLAQPWADKDRVIVYGGSYGGYMVLMALTRQPDLWKAGIDLVGPSSWRSFMASTSGLIREILSKEFGSVEQDGDFLDSISPLKDAAKISAPLLVYQGQNDPRVPRPESDQIVRVLRERGVPVEYLVMPNEGHSLDRRENKLEFFARTARFLEKHFAPKQ